MPTACRPADLSDEDEGPQLCFNPLSLGRAAAVLPPHLRYRITFAQDQQQRFVEQLMDALNQVPRLR